MSKYLIEPGNDNVHRLGAIGARIFHADPAGTGVAILEHPLEPRGLAAPIHTHENEDEYSFIFEGTVGFDIGGDVFEAGPGAFVIKPRKIPHAFWNAGDTKARICEIISPAGFEQYFVELAKIFPENVPPNPDEVAGVLELSKKYDLDMDLSSLPGLLSKYNLRTD